METTKRVQTAKTVKANTTVKVAKKQVAKKKVAKKATEPKNITQAQVWEKARNAKKYQKMFIGVRSNLLSGKTDKAINLTAFDIKVLKQTKKSDAVSTALFKWLVKESEHKADYTCTINGKEVHVKYSDIYSQSSVLGAIAKIANDKALQIKFAMYF